MEGANVHFALHNSDSDSEEETLSSNSKNVQINSDANYSKHNGDICQINVPKVQQLSKTVVPKSVDRQADSKDTENKKLVKNPSETTFTKQQVRTQTNPNNKVHRASVSSQEKNNDFRSRMADVPKNGTSHPKGKIIRVTPLGDNSVERNPKQRPPLHDFRNASPLFEKDETSDSVPTTPMEFVALPSNSRSIEPIFDRTPYANAQTSELCKNYSDSEVESDVYKRRECDKNRMTEVSKKSVPCIQKASSYSVPGTPLLIRNNTNPNFNNRNNYYISSGMQCPNSGLNGGLRHLNSSKSLKLDGMARSYWERPGSDNDSVFSKPSDRMSIRSLTSIGMGSTDGKKIIIRKVPTSPVELLNLVNSSMPLDEYVYEKNSQDGQSIDGESLYLKPNRRQHWSNKLQFVLACIGYTVGLGSVWRFPYLCYQSGGGVFLIPYFITMIICGIPMLYMELAIGQFTGRGPIGALDQLCPLFKGAGLASVVISFLLSTYYSVIIAYGIYYFFSSFKDVQPWVKCDNRWNTLDCWVPNKGNRTVVGVYSRTPAEEFYDYKVLQISDGIEHPEGLRWELVACLLCAWILIYFAIWKSIKSSAKVRYLTTTLPFLLILVFLGKSLTLEGANLGTRYFFKPQWELLSDAKVWVNAVTQTFNSMGIAFGSMISFASYNKFNNNIVQDTLAVSFVNAVTSLLVGIYSFATIGNIALEQNKSIDDVIADGPGLIFVVYPQAMGKMPASVLWSSLFFFMLICLGLNSMFAIVEVVVTSIQDGFPDWIKKHLLCHEMLVLVICVVSFFCGLPNVTKGGIYFFQLLDHYAASVSLIYLAFFEVVAVAWFYGVKRLCDNIKSMTGHTPNLFFRFCWLLAAPLLILAIWVSCLVGYESPTYNNGQYEYPVWARALGWTISSLSIIAVPLLAIYVFMKSPGKTLLEKFRNSIQPNIYECPKCGNFVCDHMDDNDDEEEFQPILINPNKSEVNIVGNGSYKTSKNPSESNMKISSDKLDRKTSTYENVNDDNIYHSIDYDNKNSINNAKCSDTGSCSSHFTDK